MKEIKDMLTKVSEEQLGTLEMEMFFDTIEYQVDEKFNEELKKEVEKGFLPYLLNCLFLTLRRKILREDLHKFVAYKGDPDNPLKVDITYDGTIIRQEDIQEIKNFLEESDFQT